MLMNSTGPNFDLATLYMDIVPKAMREYRREMQKSGSGCLTVPQFRVLAYLNNYEPANNRTLAEHQGVSVAAMSRMIDSLVRQSLVERFADKRDRRQVFMRPTRKGKAKYLEFRKEARDRLQTRMAALDPGERRRLNNGLAALAKAVERMGSPT